MSQNGIKAASDSLNRLEGLIKKALRGGADKADAIFFASQSESVSWRVGKLEDLERSENMDLGLRVFVGSRQAIVSSCDLGEKNMDSLVDRAVDMARNAPEDRFSGLADPSLLAHAPFPDLDLHDMTAPTSGELQDMARETEELALATEGITNSQGAGAGYDKAEIALCNSDGFAAAYRRSSFSLSLSVIAGSGGGMERDYAYSSKHHLADLDSPAEIAREAADRALRRLNPRKAATGRVPVIYDPRVSKTLLGHFAGAINGQSIARGTSFLKDQLNQQIFPADIAIIDDPHLVRGPASRPFDGEGVANGRLNLVEEGVLKGWLLDSGSARQLGLTSNGRASRGTSSPPSPASTNIHIAPGKETPEELMADIASGFYVTELIGMGVNGLTGDYSRGASGFWIENGKIAYPVNEVTIAGNLQDMYRHLRAADDLDFKYGTDAPTLRIDSMMIAGN